jgi:hypothetical protein
MAVHSHIVWQAFPDGPGDTPVTVLPVVIARLRAMNANEGAREISIAIQRLEEGLHWLKALDERRRSA